MHYFLGCLVLLTACGRLLQIEELQKSTIPPEMVGKVAEDVSIAPVREEILITTSVVVTPTEVEPFDPDAVHLVCATRCQAVGDGCRMDVSAIVEFCASTCVPGDCRAWCEDFYGEELESCVDLEWQCWKDCLH